jgi:hypothetical protein
LFSNLGQLGIDNDFDQTSPIEWKNNKFQSKRAIHILTGSCGDYSLVIAEK